MRIKRVWHSNKSKILILFGAESSPARPQEFRKDRSGSDRINEKSDRDMPKLTGFRKKPNGKTSGLTGWQKTEKEGHFL